MNHPKREEWPPYLFGETSPAARQKLAEHLESCPRCATEIAGWQRSLKKLDSWTLPGTRARSSSVAGPFLKWGIAAALIMGAAFGFGRLSAPSAADLKTLRTELETSVSASLAAGIRRHLEADLQSSLAATSRQLTNELRAQLNIALAETANASAAEARRQFNEFIKLWNAAREDDRRTVFGLVEGIQKQHAADYLSLRDDLETVAALTDEEIRRARQSLIQLAANKSNSKP